LQRTSERSKNVGLFHFGAFAEITEESVHHHYSINVLGTILTVREAIKRSSAEDGCIINLSAIVGSHSDCVVWKDSYSIPDALRVLRPGSPLIC